MHDTSVSTFILRSKLPSPYDGEFKLNGWNYFHIIAYVSYLWSRKVDSYRIMYIYQQRIFNGVMATLKVHFEIDTKFVWPASWCAVYYAVSVIHSVPYYIECGNVGMQ